MGIFCNDGLTVVGNLILGIEDSSTFILRIFINPITPSQISELTDFFECTLPDYGGIYLVPTTWVRSGSTWIYPYVTFNFGLNDNITSLYGWYISDSVSRKLIASGLFPTPYVVPNQGGLLRISLNFWLNNGS